MGPRNAKPNWGTDVLRGADFQGIKENIKTVFGQIDKKWVDVYLFLADRFVRVSVAEDLVFQYVYRLFYMLDGAHLSQKLMDRYFELMEAARGSNPVDIRSIVKALYDIPNSKGKHRLLFSFATKLAHTVNSTHAIYDGNVTTYFGFGGSTGPGFDAKLQSLMNFYSDLNECYKRTLADGALADVVQQFRDTYSPLVPDVKILDFIFMSAGNLGLSVSIPPVVAGASATSGVNQAALGAKG